MSDLHDKIRSLATRQDTKLGFQAAARIAKGKLDALELFRPTDYQEHVVRSDASEILVQGAPRTGKSVVVAAMMAAYVRDMSITFADGTKHRMREEEWQNRPVILWLIGLQLNHIGQTLYRLLCKPGAFDIVRDPVTGEWRAWQPGRIPGDDKIPRSKRKPAPPFIPRHEILKESWQDKTKDEFSSLTHRNGTMIYAYASTANVKRGDPVNRIWIDEEIKFSAHYAEWQSRISDTKGKILWTSWPDAETPALLRLYRRCQEQRREVSQGFRVKADVVNFVFSAANNRFMDEDEKRKRKEGWNEDETTARFDGEFATANIRAYADFSRTVHVVDYGSGNPLNDKVTEAMRKLNWNAPPDWSVDIILDPGTTRPALIWGAIPPPDFWDNGQPYHVVFRELAVPRLDADQIAHRVRVADPGRRYCRFIIDRKAGDQTPMGFSWKVHEQYARAFKRAGLTCQVSGTYFAPGEHVWQVRHLKLKEWLAVRPGCMRPRLRVVPHTCPTLCRQLEETVKAINKEEVKDKIADGQVHDVLDTLEYWAGNDPVYLAPPAWVPVDSMSTIKDEDDRYWASVTTPKTSGPPNGAIVLGM